MKNGNRSRHKQRIQWSDKIRNFEGKAWIWPTQDKSGREPLVEALAVQWAWWWQQMLQITLRAVRIYFYSEGLEVINCTGVCSKAHKLRLTLPHARSHWINGSEEQIAHAVGDGELGFHSASSVPLHAKEGWLTIMPQHSSIAYETLPRCTEEFHD